MSSTDQARDAGHVVADYWAAAEARDWAAFGALVAEPLFLIADSAIVGRIGTAPLGSLGVAAQALEDGATNEDRLITGGDARQP